MWSFLWPREVKTQILVKGRNCAGHKGTESERPIVMAGVWGANFGHLYPMLVPDDWWWRCFMRPIYLIPSPLHQLSWVKCHSENKIQKISEFVLLFILSNTFIGFVQFWSEGCPLQDIVWKGNQTLALVSVQSFCESHATHFHTQGEMPNKCNHCG